MAKTDALMAAAAKSMADSARNLEDIANSFEESMNRQNSLLESLVDKLDKIAKNGGKAAGGGGEKKGAMGALKGFAGDFKTLTGSLTDLASAGPKLKEGFKALTNGLQALNLSLKVFAAVDKGSVNLLTNFLTDLSEKFEQMNLRRIQKGADAIDAVAGSIMRLGLTLVASTLLYAIGAVGSLVIIPLIAGYSMLFYEIGDKDVVKQIDAGARAMLMMGAGLLSFGLGLFAVKELAGGNWKEFAMGALIVGAGAGLFSLLFYEIGKDAFAKRIEAGSLAMMTMGIGLASLALGIFAFQALAVDMGSILVTGAAILIVGVAMGLAGVFSKEIEEGSIALIASGLGIASLAFGIWSMQALGVDLKSVLVTGAAVLIVGAAMGLAGIFALEIALGGLAFIVSGIALYALSKGIMSFKDIEQEDIGVAAESIVGIGLAMAGAGLVSPLIFFGAASVLVAGAALSTISKGLEEFKKVKFEEEDRDKIGLVIGGLSSAFSLAGGAGSELGGVMGFLGIEGPNAVKRGIESVMGAGKALKDIANGLADFDKFTNKLDIEVVKNNIVSVLTAVSDAFGKIGAGKQVAEGGILGTLFGAKQTEVAEGINAVHGMGKEITDLAEGVKNFATMTFKDVDGKMTKLTPDDLTNAAMNIASVLNIVSTAFGTIGKGNQVAEGGILGTLFGAKDNAVAEGVSATKGMGREIADLAEGVRAFASMTFKDPEGKMVKLTPDDLTAASMNIKNVLTLVSSVFGAIGSGAQQEEGGLLGTIFGAKDNAVKLGVEAVSGIGKELKTIADSVVAFAGVKDVATAQKNIISIITAVPAAFSKVYLELLSKMDVGKMKDAFNPILSMLGKVVDALGAVKDKGITDKDGTVIANAINSIFESINSTAGTDVDALEQATKHMLQLAGTSTAMDSLAKSFEKIAKTMGKFGSTFKTMDKDALKNSTMLIQSLVTFSKVDPNALNALSDKGQSLINYIYDKAAPRTALPTTTSTPPTAVPPPVADQKGIKPVETPKSKEKENPVNAQMQQAIISLQSDMSEMKGILTSINSALAGKLKVVQVN